MIRIEDMVRALDKIKVSKDQLPPLLNPNTGQCVFCKKFLPVKNMPIRNTGIVMVQEPLCPECLGRFKDQARIACVKCKVVVLWVDPCKERTGFVFEPRKIYHIKNCPSCEAGIESSHVLEKVVYFKNNNIPYE